MRVVLDTNVLLAAIATHGLCQALVTLVYRDHVIVLLEHILAAVGKHHRGEPCVACVAKMHTMVVDIEGYAFAVPFVTDGDVWFLKTIIPSRKMTKHYLGGKDS